MRRPENADVRHYKYEYSPTASDANSRDMDYRYIWMAIPVYSARISDPLKHRRGYSPYMAHRRTASAARRNIWNDFLCSELEDLAIIHVLCHRSHPIHYNRHHRYNRHTEVSGFQRTMNKKAEQGGPGYSAQGALSPDP